jgi:hypothetical protein
VQAVNVAFLTFTLFLARLPIAGELAYMSEAYTTFPTSWAVFYSVTEYLNQLTPAINVGSASLIPIIGFSENNIYNYSQSSYYSPMGVAFID